MPQISVIVPIYSIEQYLPRCVDSVLSQTFEDFELILVDDGSPDNCPALCDEYVKKDKRIRVIHQENQGQAGARNHGVREASAPYVSFVDGDVAIHPQMLEILWRGIEETGAPVAMCREYEAHEMTEEFVKPTDTAFRKVAINDDSICELIQSDSYVYWAPWPKLIKREILLKFPFTVGRIYEDSAVVFRWLCEAGTIADCDAKLYFYQVNESGTTKKAFSLKRLDKLWSWEEQIRGYAEMEYSRALDICFHSYMFAVCEMIHKVSSELSRKDIARQLRKKGINALKTYCDRVTITKYEEDRWTAVLRPSYSKLKWKLQHIFKKKG